MSGTGRLMRDLSLTVQIYSGVPLKTEIFIGIHSFLKSALLRLPNCFHFGDFRVILLFFFYNRGEASSYALSWP